MGRLEVVRQGPLATVTLNNSPLNTLDIALMRELETTFRELAANSAARGKDGARVIVLKSGVAGQFSQGLDPKAVLAADVEGRKQIFLALGAMVEAIWMSQVPLVVDISGPALAGGAVLAALADFALIDAEKGKICFSEVKVGLPVPRFIQELVKAKVNPAAGNEVILLGRNIDAAEALRIGFANAVYSTPAERDELMKSYVGRLTRLPPATLSATLRAARQPYRALFDEFRADLGEFAEFLSDDYLGRGLGALVRGESPKF